MGENRGKMLMFRSSGGGTSGSQKPPEDKNLFIREYQKMKNTGGLLTVDFPEMQIAYDRLGSHPDVEEAALRIVDRDLQGGRWRAQTARSEAMSLYLTRQSTNLQLEVDVAATLLFEDLASITIEVVRAALNNDMERKFIQPYGVLACATLVGLWLADSSERLLAVSGSENPFTSFEIEDDKRKRMNECHEYFSRTPMPSFAASLNHPMKSMETIMENARRVIRISGDNGDPESGPQGSQP
jgi:hypothetical protein